MKNKRVTVQGPVKKPQMDEISRRGGYLGDSGAVILTIPTGTAALLPMRDGNLGAKSMPLRRIREHIAPGGDPSPDEVRGDLRLSNSVFGMAGIFLHPGNDVTHLLHDPDPNHAICLDTLDVC